VTLFDAYLMVDWSASSKPTQGKDSIWIALAVRERHQLSVAAPENPRTRAAAASRVRDLLHSLVARELRVLVGFDFPYGYPRGLAEELGSPSDVAPWRATWDRLCQAIHDDNRNENNRFEVASDLNAKLAPGSGPFWGCPPIRQTETLRSTGCSFPYHASGRVLARKRAAEQRLRGVQETWKLYGNGCVGSQALVGIPRVASLRDDEQLASVSRVWPFETGFTGFPMPAQGSFVLHAEIWPGVVPINQTLHAIRDAAQVLTLSQHFATCDERGDLGMLFRAPDGLDASALDACIREEGWILGA
jgi:hypothetical protein